MKIEFDRSLAKGRFVFALLVALGIMLIPFVAFLLHNCILCVLSSICILEGSTMNALMSTYESYLNPNFGDLCSPERGYKLLLAYLGAFLLNGLLISLVVSWIQNRRERWEKGDLHYRKSSLGNFSIVIGGNEMVPDLVSQLLKDKHLALNHVLVMTNRNVPALRKKFVSELGKEEKKVVIYYGERTSKEDLKQLILRHTKDIYVIGEQMDIDQTGSHHDTKNMDCVQKMAAMLKSSELKEKIPCHVMFEYQSTFSVLQFAEVIKDISDVFLFKPFNYYETWAQKVLVSRELVPTEKSEYLPLEGRSGILENDNDSVHLIVVGMSRMGIAMAVEAAHIAHYPNFISKGKRTRITFIDSEAQREMNFFQGHYKELFAVSRWQYMKARQIDLNYEGDMIFEDKVWHDPLNDNESQSPYRPHLESNHNSYNLGNDFIDVEWQFIEGDLEMPAVQRYISDEAKRNNCRLTIAICIPKDNASLAASLYLPNNVYEEKSCVQQVLVYQPYGDAMQKSFKNDSEEEHRSYKLFAKLRAFGMMNKCYDIETQQLIEKMLKQTEEAYNSEAGKQIPGRNKIRKRFGLPEAFKGKPAIAKQWSSYYSVSHMWTKLRSVNYDGTSEELKENDISKLAQVEHIRWNLEQLLMGYEPLNADKFIDLKNKFEEGKRLKTPSDETFLKIENDKREKIPEEEYLDVVNWLKGWKAFDDTKEQLKANMEHADICAYDILETIDKDSMSYDVIMVKALPKIYRNIRTSGKSNDR